MCLKSLLATPFTSHIVISSFDIIKMIMAALILCDSTLTSFSCKSPCAVPELDLWEFMCRKLWFLFDVSLWICALAVSMSMNVWMSHCVCVCRGVIGGWRGGKATSRSKVVHQPGCQVERVAQSFAALLFWRDTAGGWGGSWQRRVEEEEEGDQD